MQAVPREGTRGLPRREIWIAVNKPPFNTSREERDREGRAWKVGAKMPQPLRRIIAPHFWQLSRWVKLLWFLHFNFCLGLLTAIPWNCVLQYVYPSLFLGGQKPEMARTIWAAFEDFQVEALDMTGALVHLVEIYWVFNVKYSPKNQNFFALLENFFHLKSSQPLTPSVISAITSMEKLSWACCTFM